MAEGEFLNPLERPDWDSMLLDRGGSFFHSSFWAKTLVEAYGYKPLYLASTGEGGLNALIPVMEIKSPLTGHRGVSLPFTDYCEPLGESSRLQPLFDRLIEYGKRSGWQYIEIRGADGFFRDRSPSSFFYGHTLYLAAGEEKIFLRFRDKKKRSIKKALREGVCARIDSSLGAMEEFSRLNCMTRKRHGLPPQPHGFFKALFKEVIAKGLGFVALASYGKAVIAGAVYLHFGNKAFYKYSASDIAYKSFRANSLVMWEAIRWCSQNGYSQLCLGRTEPENIGLRQFKADWGAPERPINYYRYDLRKESFVQAPLKVSGFHNRIFRAMPVPLLKVAGALTYRHMG